LLANWPPALPAGDGEIGLHKCHEQRAEGRKQRKIKMAVEQGRHGKRRMRFVSSVTAVSAVSAIRRSIRA